MEITQFIQKLENRKPSILGSEMFVKFAVLLPLIKKNKEVHVLFEVRSEQLRRQPGEICFPGGKVDPDDLDERYTAVRETIEELGIGAKDITHLTPLDYLVTPFGTMIFPFVGIINNPESITPNPAEVGETFSVPISFFLENEPKAYQIKFKVEPEDNFPFNDIIGGQKYNWQIRGMNEYFYYYKDRVIWGLTAMIIKHYVELIKN